MRRGQRRRAGSARRPVRREVRPQPASQVRDVVVAGRGGTPVAGQEGKMSKFVKWNAALVCVLMWAGSAQAVVWCVDETNLNCEQTIAQALLFAYHGDTIRVRPGVYPDTVQIEEPLHRGIRILGSPGAIIDARTDGNMTNTVPFETDEDAGFHVFTRNIQITGVTILGGLSDHILLAPAATDFRGVGIRSINASGLAINIPEANDVFLGSVEIVGAAGGIDIFGDAPVLDRIEIEGVDGPAIVLDSDDAVITRTKLSRVVNGRGIFITGDRATIDKPVAENIDREAIEIQGNDASVVGAKLTGVGGGIVITGDSPIVEKNRIEQVHSAGPGISVACTTCSGTSILKNRVESVGGGTAIELAAAGPGAMVVNNRVASTGGPGYDLTGSNGATVENNRAQDIGASSHDCYTVAGDNNTLEKNLATNCSGNGFSVTGMANTLDRNTSKDALQDGIEVGNGADGTQLIDNKTQGNALYGVEVSDGATPSMNTTLDGNKASKNTIADLCNEGASVTLLSNNFPDVENQTQDGVRDCLQ